MWTVMIGAALAATPDEWMAQGMAAQRDKDADTAIERYTECLAAAPDHVGCHWEIGWSYWTRGEWEKVVEHWNRVAALDPSHPDVGKHLPLALGHMNSLAAARATAAGAPDTVHAPMAAGRTLRLRAVGDIMLGSDFPAGYMPPDDGAHLLDSVRDLLVDADLTFGNLEGPLCDSGTTQKCKPGQNCYAFRTPTRYGRYLQDAGFDLLSTANNHAEDFGVDCRMETEKTLFDLGIGASGRPGTIAAIDADGVKVAMIGFHTSRNSHYVNDHATAAELVKSLDAAADIVIVSFHGGAEGSKAQHVPDKMEVFYGEDRGHLRQFARTVVDAGADIVLGHGPHVLRGLELVDGHLVAYSMGNFATYGRFNLSGPLGTSMVLEVTLDHEGKLVSGKILPVRQIGEGVPEPDPDGTAIDLVRSLSDTDFGDRAPVIAKDGSFAPRP